MRFQQCIVDPAWKYNNRLTGKNRTRFGSGASGKYQTETTEAMASFQVSELMEDASQIHVWTTGPFLSDAIALIDAWEFSYVTVEFVWVKILKEITRQDAMRQIYSNGITAFLRKITRTLPGHYTASNAEFVLLGTRGDKAMLPLNKLEPQTIYAPPLEHSRKPNDVHEYIERNYPGMTYLELFARRTRPGWVTLGNEIDGRDLRESILEVLAADVVEMYPRNVIRLEEDTFSISPIGLGSDIETIHTDTYRL